MVELGGYEGCLGAVVTVVQGEIRMSMPARKYGKGYCDVFVALERVCLCLRKGIVAGAVTTQNRDVWLPLTNRFCILDALQRDWLAYEVVVVQACKYTVHLFRLSTEI